MTSPPRKANKTRSGKHFPNGDGHMMKYDPDNPNAAVSGNIAVSRDMAARALGRALLTEEVVHFTNCVKDDLRPMNLAVCSRPTSSMLTVRMRAIMACGIATYRKCEYCKKYDDPKHLRFRRQEDRSRPHYWHEACARQYQADRKDKIRSRGTPTASSEGEGT